MAKRSSTPSGEMVLRRPCAGHAINPGTINTYPGKKPGDVVILSVTCSHCGRTGNVVIENTDVEWHDR